MQSTTFIREATTLIADIKEFGDAFLSNEDEQAQGIALQKRVSTLFAGLSNPTLPSASKLRDICVKIGFQVDPRVVQRLAQAENLWSF